MQFFPCRRLVMNAELKFHAFVCRYAVASFYSLPNQKVNYFREKKMFSYKSPLSSTKVEVWDHFKSTHEPIFTQIKPQNDQTMHLLYDTSCVILNRLVPICAFDCSRNHKKNMNVTLLMPASITAESSAKISAYFENSTTY